MSEHGQPLDKNGMAAAVAADIPHGSFVNLGIGLPTTVSEPSRRRLGHHAPHGERDARHGSRGHGDEVDPDLINAGKLPVTELPGASYFHHADSFAMMRGGHLDVCVLGAYQVSAAGDLANWHTGKPGAIPAVGGAMDLALGAKETYVMMTLLTRDGAPKLVQECTFPLTAVQCVKRVYTDLATFVITPEGVEVRACTARPSPTSGLARRPPPRRLHRLHRRLTPADPRNVCGCVARAATSADARVFRPAGSSPGGRGRSGLGARPARSRWPDQGRPAPRCHRSSRRVRRGRHTSRARCPRRPGSCAPPH